MWLTNRLECRHDVLLGSTSLDALALFSIEQGLAGLEYTSGIPGTVGGAIVGNAGAFGKQVGDVLKSVTLISKTGIRRKVGPEALGFTYRYSNLKERAEMVVAARFALQPGSREKLLEERTKILGIRHEKHPNLTTHPCAGSFFRNVEPTSRAEKRQAAGWFWRLAVRIYALAARPALKSMPILSQRPRCTTHQLSRKMQQIKEKFISTEWLDLWEGSTTRRHHRSFCRAKTLFSDSNILLRTFGATLKG